MNDISPHTLIDVRPNEAFTDETIVNVTRVLVTHRLEPLQSGGTRIVYGTVITGPGAEELGFMVTGDFPRGAGITQAACGAMKLS